MSGAIAKLFWLDTDIHLLILIELLLLIELVSSVQSLLSVKRPVRKGLAMETCGHFGTTWSGDHG